MATAPPMPAGFVPLNQQATTGGNAAPPANAPPMPAGFVPLNASQTISKLPVVPAQQPQQAAPPAPKLTDNPNGEGIYRMTGPDGKEAGIPYSNAKGAATRAGFKFADDGEYQRFMKDYLADPGETAKMAKVAADDPGVGLFLGGARHALKTVLGIADLTNKGPKTGGVLEKQAQTQGNNPVARGVREFANEPDTGLAQHIGGGIEDTAEFMGGGEIYDALKGMFKAPVALADAAKVEQEIKKGSVLGKLAQSALKQGTVAGGQQLAKTGGDVGSAVTVGAENAGLSALGTGAGAVGDAAKTMLEGTGAADAAAETARVQAATLAADTANQEAAAARAGHSAAYSDAARGMVKPHLEAINAARANAEPMMASGAKAIDVDRVLNTVHDFTGAADRLAEINQEAYEGLDKATDGKFLRLNKEVAAAQKAAWRGGDEDVQAYANKLNEMHDLLDGYTGKAGMEELPAVKASWVQSYALRDLGNAWDRNLRGLPGASQVSNAQRGINGKGLRDDLVRAVKTYTRPKLEQMLGPGRLDNLEQIADANMTDRQRAVFNGGVRTVAEELEKLLPKPGAAGGTLNGIGRRALVMTAGAAAGHLAGTGPYMGAIAAEGGYEGTHAVLNALKANPKIAQNFLFALQSGARAERYGPFIAEMIQKANAESEQEEGDQ